MFVLQHASADVEKMILGNKCDMNDKRQVSKERGEKLAIDYGIKFLETSAKSSINVEEVSPDPTRTRTAGFLTLARDIMSRLNRKMVSRPEQLGISRYFQNDGGPAGGGGQVKISDPLSKKSVFRRSLQPLTNHLQTLAAIGGAT
ncbi:hypothetical protein CCH79_00020323 [Gambusia affinis]|uniref:small monomeric GTPase n=1 Tax=Gambusia affinis TaxID=33528 RepID=A0A315VRW1_GAMAF|nr:hypothetical protein CCH79_00020323 [Gambusia affinis]